MSTDTCRYAIDYAAGTDAVRIDGDFSKREDGKRTGNAQRRTIYVDAADIIRIGVALSRCRSSGERGHRFWHLKRDGEILKPCPQCPKRFGGEADDAPEE